MPILARVYITVCVLCLSVGLATLPFDNRRLEQVSAVSMGLFFALALGALFSAVLLQVWTPQ